MKVLARAKINLWLSVGPRRGEGLHEIVSVMQSVSLADELRLDVADQTTLDVSPPGAAPEDDTNLIVRAVKALRASTGADSGVAMRVEKRIPMAAGLAGGSADAAAALVGLNELWGTRLSRKALERIGASIGSDVPFCIRGGTAMVRGAGEDLSPLACPRELWWVLASDGTELSTADVYARRDELGLLESADPYELSDALARADSAGIAANLRNDLAEAAVSLSPGIAFTRDALLDAGAIGVGLSGSGSAWFGLARGEQHASHIARRIASRTNVCWVDVAISLPQGAWIVE